MFDPCARMRPSRVLAKLRRGEVATCTKLNLGDPRTAEIAAMAGFDCIWVCVEHCANTIEQIENQVRAAKIYDVDVAVRVQRGSYSDLVRPLEMDAAGIIVPHCMSTDDARQIAHFTRFHPVGRRPVDGGNTDGAYTLLPFQTYIQQANEQRFVIAQIEDPEPLKELDAIANTPGIDMLLFGPGDFSHAIGAPAQWDDPRLEDARRRVAKACRDAGKFAGTVSAPGQHQRLIDMGYQFLNCGADVVGLSAYFRQMRASFDTVTAQAKSYMS